MKLKCLYEEDMTSTEDISKYINSAKNAETMPEQYKYSLYAAISMITIIPKFANELPKLMKYSEDFTKAVQAHGPYLKQIWDRAKPFIEKDEKLQKYADYIPFIDTTINNLLIQQERLKYDKGLETVQDNASKLQRGAKKRRLILRKQNG